MQNVSKMIPLRNCNSIWIRDGRFGSKVGQIGPNWDKSGTFSDQISVHLAQKRQNVLKCDVKKLWICLIWWQFLRFRFETSCSRSVNKSNH